MIGEPGAEIVHPTPGFPIYESMINYTGAKAVPYDLTKEKDLKFDPEKILSSITDKTRLVILINPNNPTGSFVEKPAIDFLVRTAERRQQRRNYNASRSAINPTSPRSPQPRYAPPRPNLSSNNPNNTGASATPSAVERDLLRGRSSRTSSLFGNPRGS